MNPKLVLAGVLLLIAIALTFIVRAATGPKETVRDPIKNPPAELRGAPGAGDRM